MGTPVQTCIAVLALLFLSFAHSQIISSTFSKIALANRPSVHSVRTDLKTWRECAVACSQTSECTGVQVFLDRCSLFTGDVLERAGAEPRNDYEAAYKMGSLSLPKCSDHKDFKVIKTNNATYCLYFSDVRKTFEAARSNCVSRLGYITFMDTWSKLLIVKQGITDAVGEESHFWNGIYRDSGYTFFKGFYGDKMLFPNNELWNPGEPSDPTRTQFLCATTTLWGPLDDVMCSLKRFYSCEILDYAEKPN